MAGCEGLIGNNFIGIDGGESLREKALHASAIKKVVICEVLPELPLHREKSFPAPRKNNADTRA